MNCPRRWEVEAVRDGRLSGAEAAAAARHQAGCRACAAEAERLAVLAAALRSLPACEPDELTARRRKQRLLADANAAAVKPPPRRWPLAAAALALLGLLGLGLRPAPPTLRLAMAASVHAPGFARWTHERTGRDETITLTEGVLTLRVRRRSPDDRVRVLVPDGEIEDTGTSFLVEVSGERTERVEVSEGAVALRLRGAPPALLSAGQSWRREPPGAPSASMPPTPGVTAAEPPRSGQANPAAADGAPVPSPPAWPRSPTASPSRAWASSPASAAPRPGQGPAAGAPGGPAPPAASAATPASAPSPFGAGFEALRQGHDGEAAERLRVAAEQAADEARSEDAAYLRTVALARAGKRDEARAAARDYLVRFPRGFRRLEIEPLAR